LPPRRDYTYRGHDNAPETLCRLFAEALQCNSPAADVEPHRPDGLDFISRTQRYVDQNVSENDAWSRTVPLVRVFNTLRTSLHQPLPVAADQTLGKTQAAPSVEEVAATLSDLELHLDSLGAEGGTVARKTPVQGQDQAVSLGVDTLFSTRLRPSYSSRRRAKHGSGARST
jgi:hypothetical protein